MRKEEMHKDELISMWKRGDDQMFRDEKTDKKMITQYLNEKTLKGSKSINFNIIFYGFIQIANLILLSLNLAGFMNNSFVIWMLVPQIIFTIGFLIYGIDLYYRLREINNYSESLRSLILKQLKFFKKPYEIWLILSAVSVVILSSNVNLYIDNDNGTYTINNKVLFVGVTIAVFLLIYGTQKVASLRSLHSLKAYLSDLQQGVLDQSGKIEQSKKKLVWFYIAVFIFLTASMILGLIKALP